VTAFLENHPGAARTELFHMQFVALALFDRLRDDSFVVSMPIIGGARQKPAPDTLGEFHPGHAEYFNFLQRRMTVIPQWAKGAATVWPQEGRY
jgi:hypothetical protein